MFGFVSPTQEVQNIVMAEFSPAAGTASLATGLNTKGLGMATMGRRDRQAQEIRVI